MNSSRLAAGALVLLLTGCSGSAPDPSAAESTLASVAATSTDEGLTLHVHAISWLGNGDQQASCAEGLSDSSFWFQDSPLSIYDDTTGERLIQTTLAAEVSATGDACNYSAYDLRIAEVANYRFVFDGRHSVTKSLVDLKILAQELNDQLGFTSADLNFVEEVGSV